MKLSNQGMGAIMMALQNSIMEQSDIVPVLEGFDFIETDNGLVVENPPVVQFNNLDSENPKDNAVENA